MPGLSEIQGQNEEISGDIFPNTWNCQILFYHNLRDSSEVANLGNKASDTQSEIVNNDKIKLRLPTASHSIRIYNFPKRITAHLTDGNIIH